MMGQLAILADDLSSCTDCGIQIARNGLQVYVPLKSGEDISSLVGYDVVAIDLASRAVSPEQAYRLAREAARRIGPHFRSFYKSIDSTLRGNLGAEIDGVMDVIAFDLAVIAPAYPFYGRTTLNGLHSLNGQPVHLTEFGSDPQRPVRESDLLKLFSSQSHRQVGHISLEALRQGKAAVASRMKALCRSGIELVVFDAMTEPDLSRIVKAAVESGLRVLWVGSTGLAGHISTILTPRPAGEGRREIQLGRPISPPTLTVSGSASQVTRLQVTQAVALSGASLVRMNPFAALQPGQAGQDEIKSCCALLCSVLATGQDAILEVVSDRATVAATQAAGGQLGLPPLKVSERIVESLAEATRLVVDRIKLAGLVLTGGDTANAVCRGLGAQGILILEEVEPGIPLAQLIGVRPIRIVTKAGGFGNPNTLWRASLAVKKKLDC